MQPNTHTDTVGLDTGSETDALIAAWVALWNNDLSQTRRVIAPDFTSHAAPLSGGAEHDSVGRDDLDVWVGGIHSVLDDLRFTVQVGPIRQDDLVVIRWQATGTYGGGIDGATAPVGTPIRFSGTDTLRVRDGLLAEYWANADSLLFAQQLGLATPPLDR
jgi:hypothetical protein